MKKIILCAAFFATAVVADAQNYKETFDTNSLEWTECAYKNAIGTAVIDKGVMTVTSKGELKGLGALVRMRKYVKIRFSKHIVMLLSM